MNYLTGPGAFRLFLASIVVLHHSFPLRLGAWAVYVFFMLSGYWIGTMWDRKYRFTRSPLMTFYVSRWWRLAPVFFSCTLLAVLAGYFLPHGYSFSSSPWTWALRQLPIAGSASAGRLLPPAWSLDVEMQFYLAAPFLILLLTRLKLSLILVLNAGALAFPLAHFFLGGGPEAPVLWPWIPLFLLGLTLHRLKHFFRGGMAAGTVGILVLVFLIVILLPETRPLLWKRGADPGVGHPSPWLDMLLLAAALFTIPFIAWNVRQPSPLFDRWMGNLAYPLYLFHWIPREFYYALADWKQPAWWNALLLLANVAVAYAGAVAILHFIDQPLDRLRANWVRTRETANPGAAK